MCSKQAEKKETKIKTLGMKTDDHKQGVYFTKNTLKYSLFFFSAVPMAGGSSRVTDEIHATGATTPDP